MRAMQQAFADLLGVLLPSWCAHCEADGPPLCARCRGLIADEALTRTLACGVQAHSAWRFDPVTAAVLRALKTDGRTALCGVLAVALTDALARAAPDPAGLAVVPVPASAAALRRRGFRVVERTLRVARLPAVPALVHARSVADQRRLGRAERAANVQGAFRLRSGVLTPGTGVVVVDDVLTTGATVNEAVRALTAGGMHVVGAATAVMTLRGAPISKRW